jgi:E3 ubiquitin-protein ligase RNF220
VKARRSLVVRNDPGSSSSSISRYSFLPNKTDLEAINAIKEVVRNRKARLSKLRDLAKDISDEPTLAPRNRSWGNQRCPVCLQEVLGSSDQSVMEAHVDVCILEAANATEQTRLWNESRSAAIGQGDDLREYEVGGERRIRVTDLAGFIGRFN